MGFSLNSLGSLISNSSGFGAQFIDGINAVGDPLMGIASPFLDLGGSFLKSVISLPTILNNSLGTAMTGLANMVNSPSFMLYLVIGGVAIAGIMVVGAPSPIKYR